MSVYLYLTAQEQDPPAFTYIGQMKYIQFEMRE